MSYLEDFKIVYAGIYDSKYALSSYQEGFITSDRPVKHYEIELYVEDGGIAYLNNVEYPIFKQHVLISKPGQTRHSLLHFRVYYIHLCILDKHLQQQLDQFPDYFEILHEHNYIKRFQDIIDTAYQDFDGKDFFLHSKIYELLYMFYIDSNRNFIAKTNHNRKNLEHVKKYLDKHYTEQLQLSDMATMANLSPVYFHKLFKSFYGDTPYNYLQELRLSAAKNMLLTTDETIENIAFSCGFSSQPYFNDVFKKKTGMSPLKFKKQELHKYKI